MKRAPMLVVFAALLAVSAAAEKAPKVKYDAATEVKVAGVIEDVKEFECPASGTVGYHVTLKAADRTVVVHVAAVRFMKEYEIVFAKGEQIQVVGSKVTMPNGEEGILAREVSRGQSTYAFRDKNGNPLW